MVEIRRDAYMAEPGGAPTAGLERVAGGVAGLVNRVTTGAGRPPTAKGRFARMGPVGRD